MLFGHTYHVKGIALMEDNSEYSFKSDLEARFVDEWEIKRAIKERLEFETDLKVVNFLEFKMI